jgi:CBS domain-containing protein
MALLSTTPVKQLAHAPVVLVSHDCTISQALQTLATHRFLSCPVWNRTTKLCLGAVDVIDILVFLLAGLRNFQDPTALSTELQRRFNLQIYFAIDFSLRNPFIPVPEDLPLTEAITKYLIHGIHRLPVVAPTGQITSLLAQMDVLEFLKNEFDKGQDEILMTLGKRTLMTSITTRSEVFCVSKDTKLREAFEDIALNQLSGLAVVDDDNKLVGNLSASDIEGLTEQTFYSVIDQTLGEITKGQELVFLTKQNTFEDAVRTMQKHRVHRLYILSQDKVPVGLITATDVMKILTRELRLGQ